jgi:hypothetical protein
LRDDLVLDMSRLRNRLHALLLLCDPEYSQVIRSLRTRRGVQAARTYVAPGTSELDRVRERAVRQVADQIALLMDQELELRANIEAGVRAHFAPLLGIDGVRAIVAAGLIAELGMPRPGFGVPQIAVLAGVAPIEAPSAGEVRHRLSRLGNRRLNMLLYLDRTRSGARLRAGPGVHGSTTTGRSHQARSAPGAHAPPGPPHLAPVAGLLVGWFTTSLLTERDLLDEAAVVLAIGSAAREGDALVGAVLDQG